MSPSLTDEEIEAQRWSNWSRAHNQQEVESGLEPGQWNSFLSETRGTSVGEERESERASERRWPWFIYTCTSQQPRFPPRNRDTGQLTHILSPGPSTGPGAGQEDSVTLMKECERGVHSGSSRDLTLGLVARFSCPLGQPTTSLALEHRYQPHGRASSSGTRQRMEQQREDRTVLGVAASLRLMFTTGGSGLWIEDPTSSCHPSWFQSPQPSAKPTSHRPSDQPYSPPPPPLSLALSFPRESPWISANAGP